MHGRSEAGRSFFAPKKADGLVARETDRVREFDAGLDDIAEVPPGVNVLAAGLGLNSRALTLNFVDTAETGVCTAGLWGLVTPELSAMGPVGGMRVS